MTPGAALGLGEHDRWAEGHGTGGPSSSALSPRGKGFHVQLCPTNLGGRGSCELGPGL